ncbi:UDP-glucose/GDP-mannose dehydrogenase family protein [Candidatus Peregrinibacteria bacterium]|nr:MAG: UDP-glucose/GDP-mannose dehydrogenase family protein [Candidatus Peregrinibacteria bacterium]
MRITIFGTGYVGLVTGVCFAEVGHEVLCIDIDAQKIALLQEGKTPFFEPGLSELVRKNIAEKRLYFGTDAKEGVQFASAVFCSVGTPPSCSIGHEPDLSAVFAISKTFGQFVKGEKILVNKSTVPPGTAEKCRIIVASEIASRGKGDTISFDVVSNPEFLQEGCAIENTLHPDRILAGTTSDTSEAILREIYAPFLCSNTPFLRVSPQTAETIKYAANCFLATKISFMNEIARFCDAVGADVSDVAQAMGCDPRIGSSFLRAGVGYGGSCLPKDVSGLLFSGEQAKTPFRILESVREVNETQREVFLEKLFSLLPDVSGKTIALLGLSFKPNTDDIREAPSLKILNRLLELGARVRAFDPVAMNNISREVSHENFSCAKDPYVTVQGVDAVLLLTEWSEFQNLDMKRIVGLMKGDIFIDGRNMFHPLQMREFGFQYVGIGRN